MSVETFTFSYPKNSGFESTSINFHSGSPDLEGLFCHGTEGQRLFVTDTSIASLPSMKPFISRFTDDGSRPSKTRVGNDILLTVGAGESFKTLETVIEMVEAALEGNFNRNCTFIAIGGGVICDMTAFAASMFKRGVSVRFVPTTLLAMVDAAIGGKSGCDFKGYKNMIGSFWPASTLDVWPEFILSLPEKEFVSGLGEAIKTALLFSPEMWKMFTENADRILRRDMNVLHRIIIECVKAKAAIVEEDFREHGRRAFLNLGHTFGHALESVAGLGTITHGEAVVWGIGRALDLSVRLGLCGEGYAEKTKEVLSSYGYDMKVRPSVLEGSADGTKERLIGAMKKDKKNISSEIRVTIQKGLCDTLVTGVSDGDIEAVL